MSLTRYVPLGITIQMEVFATGVAGQLRVVVTVLALFDTNGSREVFHLAFLDENCLGNGVISSHIEVSPALARTVVAAPQFPCCPDEHQDTLDAILNDPAILALIQKMAVTQDLLKNITSQIASLNQHAELENFIPEPPPISGVKPKRIDDAI